jgi:hypothetical protein
MKIIQTRIENMTIDDLRPLKDYNEPPVGALETEGYVIVSTTNNEYDQILLATGSVDHYTPSENEKILHIIQLADFINVIEDIHIRVINIEEV